MSNIKIMVEKLQTAIGAHGAWKLRLRTAATTGSSAITPAQARCDKSCDLGKWLHGHEIDATTKQGMPYKVVTRLHKEFHESASQVLTEAVANRREPAVVILEGDFRERSEKLGRALAKWRSELSAAH